VLLVEGLATVEDGILSSAAHIDSTDWIVPDAPGFGVDVDEVSLTRASDGFQF
jgi:hypothetical protein